MAIISANSLFHFNFSKNSRQFSPLSNTLFPQNPTRKHSFSRKDFARKVYILKLGTKSSLNSKRFGKTREVLVFCKEEGTAEIYGEDAAKFDVKNQSISSWIYFTGILGTVLGILYVGWMDPNTGFGGAYVDAVSSLSSSHEVVLLILLFIFAVQHSGMASFREAGEKLIGERAYRVLFAGLSLPLAFSAVAYFINHRYDGVQLWQVQNVPGVHPIVWLLSFISFFFLYPSTFNLLEVAAVDKPKMHLWETGIIRITRHPQMVGQTMWCMAHMLWMGNSMVLTASVGLIAHHLYGVWNGDRRLAVKYGEAFESVKKRTSITPFAAIIQGRQKLPKEYYKEFVRVPYVTILSLTLAIYFAHPLLQGAAYRLHW